jgi:DNA-directed RNA polymerase specialized sigma24 family protein
VRKPASFFGGCSLAAKEESGTISFLASTITVEASIEGRQIMAHTQAGTILRHIRSLVDISSNKELTDAELLDRFVVHREEAAFAALVERHGRLVWGVCKHFLRQEQDSEDAFQATFFVLARRAGSIRKAASVGSWLYGVAYKVAMKAKQRSRRQKAREGQTRNKSSTQPRSDLAWRELRPIPAVTSLSSAVPSSASSLVQPFSAQRFGMFS